MGNEFHYQGEAGTHLWYDGTPAALGNSPGSGTSSRLSTTRPRFTPAPRTRRCSAQPTVARHGERWSACAAMRRLRRGSRALAAYASTRSSSVLTTPSRMFVAISAAGVFRSEDAVRPGGPPTTAESRRGPSRSRCGCRALCPPHRAPPVPPGCAVHAEALGRHAQRRRGQLVARHGRGAAVATSGSASTCTPTSPRRSMSSR